MAVECTVLTSAVEQPPLLVDGDGGDAFRVALVDGQLEPLLEVPPADGAVARRGEQFALALEEDHAADGPRVALQHPNHLSRLPTGDVRDH